ncbi:hypothetical protein [Haloterrigena salinisoli]|uniref:hypothetical protein n=1 Tax=Haloterrigena salinisoli TaxID=3132747 RepID=UPI0030D1A051
MCISTQKTQMSSRSKNDVPDGLQFGGQWNYGYGTTRLKATQVVELDDLDQIRLKDAEKRILELVTPLVLRSEYPETNDVGVLWWFWQA